MRFLNTNKIVSSNVPVDVNGAGAVSGDYVSMKNYGHLTILIHMGVVGDAGAVTLKQATDVAGTSEKALAFTKMFANEGLTGDTFTDTAVSSNTFNHAATANNMYVIDVDSRSLDGDNGFDCVRVNIAAQAGAATILGIIYILSEARFQQAAMPSAIID